MASLRACAFNDDEEDEGHDLEDKDDEDKDEDHGDGEDENHEDDDADAGGEVVGITVELGRHFAGKIFVIKIFEIRFKDSKFGLSSADTFKEIKFYSKNIATVIVIIIRMVNQWLTFQRKDKIIYRGVDISRN